MNLKDITKIKDQADDGVWVPWSEGDGGAEFKLSYMGREIIKQARKKALKKELNRKTHRFEENIDEDILDREMMNLSVLGWRGLKAKHLKEVLDPTTISLEIAESQVDAEIEFTPENKEVLLRHYNLNFNRFVTGVSLEVETYRKYKEDELTKNL